MIRKKRVLVGVSGGVDSLAAALLLQEQGFEVSCVTFVSWNKETEGVYIPPSKADPEEAAIKTAELCRENGFNHYLLPLAKEFDEKVIQYFISEYLSGRTPNICSHCNRFFKFEQLQIAARKFNCEYIATGHYANIRKENERYVISRSFDDWKDQSYMLWQLPQNILKMCILPLGNTLKAEVKEYVKKQGFPEQADQNESFNICFIPDNNYKEFLCRRIRSLEEILKNGELLNTNGEKIGVHDGFPFYTIGQSKNLITGNSSKLYVKEVIPHKNRLILSSKDEVFSSVIHIHKINFIKYGNLQGRFSFWVRIRGKDHGTQADVCFDEDGEAIVYFSQPAFAPAVGQSAVFYEGDDVVCGGVICRIN